MVHSANVFTLTTVYGSFKSRFLKNKKQTKMDTQKQSIIDRIKQANNILVTVSRNPSIDQLASAIGFTLALNKLGKHAIAVFSGEAPSVIEFLKPEETFEKNTDSLRDFIISLDKAKADKLRYKVEDEMVKIFITPYRTSLSDKDLVFSQGDFNVEVIVALGVREQKDLDDAITAQGRILHDATVVDINNGEAGQIGTLIWSNPKASSLCEMLVSLLEPMKANLLDAQMATAFLTGIVAETERFSNEKTSPAAMQASSKLMSAGANQQLVASQLAPPEPVTPVEEVELPAPVEEPEPVAPDEPIPSPVPASTSVPAEAPEQPRPEPEKKASQFGELNISHASEEAAIQAELDVEASEEEKEDEVSQIHIDDQGLISSEAEKFAVAPSQASTRGMTLVPPTLGGQLTANSEPEHEHLDPSTDILGDGANKSVGKILSRSDPRPATTIDNTNQTLPMLDQAESNSHLDAARNAVDQVAGGGTPTPAPPTFGVVGTPPGQEKDPTTDIIDPVAPPPVPPPMMPPSFTPPNSTDSNSL